MFLLKRSFRGNQSKSGEVWKQSMSKEDIIESEEPDPNELLEYDLWEGQFSLSDNNNPEDDEEDTVDYKGLAIKTSAGVPKAVKDARNQQKILDRCTSVDIENLIQEFDETKGFDFDSNYDKRVKESVEPSLQKQMSTWSQDGKFLENLPANHKSRLNGDYYLLQWQQSIMENEELSGKVQTLTDKVNVLSNNQAENDEKYSKSRQENATLRARINELEDEVKELQMVSKEQLELEQKRTKEIILRLEKGKEMEVEKLAFKIQSFEIENQSLQDEISGLHQIVKRLKMEKEIVEDQLIESKENLHILKEENETLKEELNKEQSVHIHETSFNKEVIEGLANEVEALKSTHSDASGSSQVDQTMTLDLEKELRSAKESLRALQAENEDLRGQMLQCATEKGRALLDADTNRDVSIGEEIGKLSDQEIRSELRDQKEVNSQLRHYIDNILMNIMERYPELLEVRK